MVSKKRFILGMISKISDKQLTVKSCILVFPTSGLELKTGNWNIRENPTIIPCNIFSEISDFPETEHFRIDSKSFRKTPKIFCESGVWLPGIFLSKCKTYTEGWPFDAYHQIV